MKAAPLRHFRSDESGAVAATYALALIPLIAFAGLAFDYARLMGVDSELQNGADQAALAGATQLDGQAGACERAANAASGMLQNLVMMAAESNLVTLTSETACDAAGQIRFYQDKEKATPATTDANARFIEVIVDTRSVDYALIPITGRLASGQIGGVAFAGLGSAICKVPPVMMCNPNEGDDPQFTTANYIGKGIRLITQDGGGTYGEGVFGYLETDSGSGANVTKELIGSREIPGNCVPTDGADIKPGLQVVVMDFFNTRFDIYASGLNVVCGTGNTNCPPSANSKNDFLKGSGAGCGIVNGGGSNGWVQGAVPYRPTSKDVPLDPTVAAGLSPMGYPRDMCHAVSKLGQCAGDKIGDGNWDRRAYFLSNSANWSWPFSMSSVFGTETPTRYQVYKYEAENPTTRMQQQSDVGTSALTAHSAPVCVTPGVEVAGAVPDRRVLSVAVINCVSNNVGPSTDDAPIQKYVDVFLVEPSANRGSGANAITEKSDVYVEVIGETSLGGGATEGQNIKKDVPYLIE
ncbi:Tad domain-containing protein [Qipengyuania sp. 1NDH17]|uniref:Tad domain-containing protein n=1 Tax=Qipengyuania polymorpha TaxID=2867234 RepID=A0ABS7IZK8_9SPHN|nr:pilus assembly protein TadG-related protein [Qipengyuania polymorpha]MBX7459001.1 Tad domain-containing protein [Qipengyuania polymorpha]